jgi:two-component system CheB/CheR fusion protein
METQSSSPDYENKFKECDDRFSAIFRLTTAASKIIDSELNILQVNDALTELIGYSSEELIGSRIMDYACEEDKHHWHELQKAMWQDGKPDFKLDACIIKKDGSKAWVHVTTIAYHESGVSYAYTILDDFTDWKKLQESEQRLHMALRYSKLAVWELDLSTRKISRSEGFDQLFGITDSGQHWDQVKLINTFLDEDQPKLKDLLDAISPGQNFDYQGRIRTVEGVVKWINFQGRAETTAEGKDRVLGTLFDITRDKLAEREKDDFISIASHELKTPLTSLKSTLQLLERMPAAPAEKTRPLLQQANKSMTKVTTLVDELLNASRMNEGQLHLKKTRFKLSKAIEDCCLHVTAAGKHRIITEGEAEIEVEADSERIQRVIVNFVNNAVKYAPSSPDIKISVSRESGKVKLSVIDKGPGIALDKVPHVFERFYRTDEEGGQYSGLGLGLYISAEIIKKHGGEIGVESEPGGGSDFWFTLPIQ